MKLGPIAAAIKGFSIRFTTLNLHSVDITKTQVSLTGISLDLHRPPVGLAGILTEKFDNHGVRTGFEVRVSIQVEPYTFIAAGGYYDNQSDGKGGTFKSLMVFTELDGPIAELEVATLEGLTGGVGYNSQVSLPTIDNITTFPFINTAAVSGGDPGTVLKNLMAGNWFTPAKGPVWLARGITGKICESLVVKAVVVVDISDDVVFGIYADASADIPVGIKNDAELFARVDLNLLPVLDPSKGSFIAEGKLTPKSFILDQNCHLTGGFALCYWFNGSGHEGDWVFTVGGYHSAFKPPTWYPTVPRLAISWQYDSTLSILGEAYFAITPKCCMGGRDVEHKLSYRAIVCLL